MIHLNQYLMKNLRKLSKKELKSVNGGIQACNQYCPTGTYKCCIPRETYYCALDGSPCVKRTGPGNPGEPADGE